MKYFKRITWIEERGCAGSQHATYAVEPLEHTKKNP